MKRIALAALGLFLAAAILGYYITKAPDRPTLVGSPASEGPRHPPLSESPEIELLEARVRSGDAGAPLLLANSLVYSRVRLQDKLEAYWLTTLSGREGDRFLPVLRRFRREVLPLVVRSLSRGERAVAAIDLADRLYSDGSKGLAACFDANARRAIGALVVNGLEDPYDRAAGAVRARALAFVDRHRLGECLPYVSKLTVTEPSLLTRKVAVGAWERLSGKKWRAIDHLRAEGKTGPQLRMELK